ncbi:hypothetical protein KAR91_78910 [Candidatus Pacearchaeota archaeon]|nr:hypothetical protein [Candidatus Pacearchaeota archaeon]
MLMKMINRKREARRKRKILERKIVRVACDNDTGSFWFHGVYVGSLSKFHLLLLLNQFMSSTLDRDIRCDPDKVFRDFENIED